MRFLFCIYPNSRAHLFPVVPMAQALQSAGHEVRVSTHVSSVDQVLAAGLTPVALGDPSLPMVRETTDCAPAKHQDEVERYAEVLGLSPEDREHWITYFQVMLCPSSDYVRVDRDEPHDLIRFARTWQPDLVVWDPVFPAGGIAARLSGAAHCRQPIGQDLFAWSMDRLAEHRDDLVAAGLDPSPIATLLEPLAEKYGLTVDDDLMYGNWTTETMLDAFRLPTSTRKLYIRHVPYGDPKLLPDWLYEEHPPRVAFSMGESSRRFMVGDWDRTPKIMKAIDGLDVEVLATLTDRQLHGVEKVPDNVRTFDWLNLQTVLPTCSSMIHHGGGGTMMSALVAGVPQLVCDIKGESLLMRLVEVDPGQVASGTVRNGLELDVSDPDQIEIPSEVWELPAKKLEATPAVEFLISKGAGARLDHRAQSISEMRELIWHVTTDAGYRERAAMLHQEWLAVPSPGEVIPALERLVAAHRPR